MAAIMLELRDPMFNKRMMGFPACQEEVLLYSVATAPVAVAVAATAPRAGPLARMAARQEVR